MEFLERFLDGARLQGELEGGVLHDYQAAGARGAEDLCGQHDVRQYARSSNQGIYSPMAGVDSGVSAGGKVGGRAALSVGAEVSDDEPAPLRLLAGERQSFDSPTARAAPRRRPPPLARRK